MSTAQQTRQDRYGGPLVSARTARILIVIGAILMVALVAMVGIRYADQPVRTKVVAYEHLAPDRIAVSFQVTMRPGTEATCTVQAMNEGAAQVGFVEVPISAQSESQTTHRVEIATQGKAVSAEVLHCTRR